MGLESLLDEAVTRARGIVDENDDQKPDGPELDESTRTAVAETVGLGGIKYADLHHNRESDYQFSWDKMLATNGDSATYMQYACARILGIFREGRSAASRCGTRRRRSYSRTTSERALAMALNRFADAVDITVVERRPNVLTGYLFETANTFSTFYNTCSVLKEEDPARRLSRLALCDLAARVFETGSNCWASPAAIRCDDPGVPPVRTKPSRYRCRTVYRRSCGRRCSATRWSPSGRSLFRSTPQPVHRRPSCRRRGTRPPVRAFHPPW
ncbi:MAG: hypothetical protein Ct9H300mP1_20840 [Planctomycetaceae bacterium]|nr:MAG: hypothetical protein Ct9H300mP1_20840 [Planctomycetaceae bacterium]